MDELQSIRSECLELRGELASAIDNVHARRRSLNSERKSTSALYRECGPHSTSHEVEYIELGRAYNRSSALILELLFQHGSEHSALLIELLEPETLELETKLIYASLILADLLACEKEYVPELTRLVDRLENDVKRLRDFVDSIVLLEVEKFTEGQLNEIDSESHAKDNASTSEELDDDPPDFEFCDEFLDDSEYRKLTKTVLTNLITPLEALRPKLVIMGETFDRQLALTIQRQSSGPHPVGQGRWISEHVREVSALMKSSTAILNASSEDVKCANRTFRSSLRSGDDLPVDALRKYQASLKVQIDRALPIVQADVERAIVGSNEIIRYIESNGDLRSRKKAWRTWGRKTPEY